MIAPSANAIGLGLAAAAGDAEDLRAAHHVIAVAAGPRKAAVVAAAVAGGQ